jgi:hypothetical protein
VLEYAINSMLAALLYVTFLQVPAAELVRSLRAGRFLAAALVVNFFVVPLVVAAMFAFLPADQAVRLGVLLVLLTSCVDYVIVLSGPAGGDSRRLLAATLLLLAAAVLPRGQLGSPGGMVTAEDELQPQPRRLRPARPPGPLRRTRRRTRPPAAAARRRAGHTRREPIPGQGRRSVSCLDGKPVPRYRMQALWRSANHAYAVDRVIA